MPAYVYFVTFMYEFGYCSHFNIPKHLITPSLTTILVCGAAIGGLLLSSLNSIKLVSIFFLPFLENKAESKWQVFRPVLALNLVLLVALVLLFNIYGLSLRLFLWLMGGYIGINGVVVGLPLLFHRGSVAERLVKVSQADRKIPDLDTWVIRKLGDRMHTIILVLLMIIFLSYLIGDGEARNQVDFLTVSSHSDAVVLRSYGDMMICARYDKSNHTISRELTLLFISKSNELSISMQKVGPLKVEDEAHPSRPIVTPSVSTSSPLTTPH